MTTLYELAQPKYQRPICCREEEEVDDIIDGAHSCAEKVIKMMATQPERMWDRGQLKQFFELAQKFVTEQGGADATATPRLLSIQIKKAAKMIWPKVWALDKKQKDMMVRKFIQLCGSYQTRIRNGPPADDDEYDITDEAGWCPQCQCQ